MSRILLSELGTVNFPVYLAALHQLVVRAGACNAAVVQHENAIRIADGSSSLRDKKDGGAVGKVAEGAAQRRVGGKIEGGGAVIEDQDARAAHQCAGNREALPLAAGEVAAALLQGKVEAALLAFHQLLRLGSGQCFPKFVVGSIRVCPTADFPALVPWKSSAFCGTTPIFTAELRGGILRVTSTPSTRTSPPVAS